MLKIIVFVVVVGMVILLAVRKSREWILERIKAASDVFVLIVLRSTSRFGSKLTEAGKAEQELWREQRLRLLRGLALKSKHASSGQQSAGGEMKSTGNSRQ